MMGSALFEIPTLGSLRITRVLASYDGPRIFVAESVAGTSFLCYWAAELGRGDRWWFIDVSTERLSSICSGRLSMRDAVERSETGWVLEVDWVDSNEAPERFEYLRTSEIRADALPGHDSFLPPSIPTNEPERPSVSILASRLGRIVMRLKIATRSHEAPAALAANMISAFQGAIDAFGQVLSGSLGERGPIPTDIVKRTTLLLTAIVPGSVEFDLVSQDLALIEDPLLAHAIETLHVVMARGGDLSALQSQLKTLQKRSVTRYKTFLEATSDVGHDIEIKWSRPFGEGERSTTLSQETIGKALDALYREEKLTNAPQNIVGELIGINKRTRRFELLDVTRHEKVSGRILPSAMEAAKRATVSEIYSAEVLRTDEYDPITDTEIKRYQLFSLAPVPQR